MDCDSAKLQINVSRVSSHIHYDSHQEYPLPFWTHIFLISLCLFLPSWILEEEGKAFRKTALINPAPHLGVTRSEGFKTMCPGAAKLCLGGSFIE